MVVDIGEVKRHIKPKADSTLHNMRKADLIAYVRTLEHNYNMAVSFNENQAKYIESLGLGCATRCKDCEHYVESGYGDGRKMCIGWDEWIFPNENDFCSIGKRRTPDGIC